MDATALIGIIGGVIITIIGLLISMVRDVKKDVKDDLKEQKEELSLKQNKSECDRLMDKHEDWLKGIDP